MHENATFWDYELAYRREQLHQAASTQRVRSSRRARSARPVRRQPR